MASRVAIFFIHFLWKKYIRKTPNSSMQGKLYIVNRVFCSSKIWICIFMATLKPHGGFFFQIELNGKSISDNVSLFFKKPTRGSWARKKF